jgi:hypothetical protein
MVSWLPTYNIMVAISTLYIYMVVCIYVHIHIRIEKLKNHYIEIFIIGKVKG